MKDDMFNVASRVQDEKSFIDFLHALAADRQGDGAWENGTIEAFLDAAAAWAEVTAGKNAAARRNENPWQRCAQILSAGKFYE
jgi:hypothetical protein